MNVPFFPLLAAGFADALWIGGLVIIGLVALIVVVAIVRYGGFWLPAYLTGADITFLSLIGMSFRQIPLRVIVNAKIMGRQAGMDIDRTTGMSTARLEAHFLAGGDVMNVLSAIIAADRAGMDLDFDRAAAIDLAGRDVLEAVQTSVSPKVIDCPQPGQDGRTMLSAVAKDGVELRVRARVTVRTNLSQLIGGATEDTIIARVGQGIITAIGSAITHMEVMATPDRISRSVLANGLDASTAFEIVSIDIADIDVKSNIGARLKSDQAEADTRMAQAAAEARRAEAIANQQLMKARRSQQLARVVLEEAAIPHAVANAFRMGQLSAVQWPRLSRQPR